MGRGESKAQRHERYIRKKLSGLTYEQRLTLIKSAQKELTQAKSNETRKRNAALLAGGAVIGFDWTAWTSTHGAEAARKEHDRLVTERRAANDAYEKAVKRRKRAERELDDVRMKYERGADDPLF